MPLELSRPERAAVAGWVDRASPSGTECLGRCVEPWENREVKLLRVGLIGWTALWALLMALGLAMSEGTPVCKGPLILGVNESDPPSCEGPAAGLVTLAPVTYLLGAALVVLMVGVVHAGGKLRGLH